MQHKLFSWTVNCQGYVHPGFVYFDRQESTQKWWHFTTKDLETLAKQKKENYSHFTWKNSASFVFHIFSGPRNIRPNKYIIPNFFLLVFTYFPAPGILGQISTWFQIFFSLSYLYMKIQNSWKNKSLNETWKKVKCKLVFWSMFSQYM